MVWLVELSQSLISKLYKLQKWQQNLLIFFLSITTVSLNYFYNNVWPGKLSDAAFSWIDGLYGLSVLMYIPLIIIAWQIILDQPIETKKIIEIALSKLLLYILTTITFLTLIFLLLVALIIPGIIAGVYYALVFQIIILDTPSEKKINQSFQISASLVKGNFQMILIFCLLLSIVPQYDLFSAYPLASLVLIGLNAIVAAAMFTSVYAHLKNLATEQTVEAPVSV